MYLNCDTAHWKCISLIWYVVGEYGERKGPREGVSCSSVPIAGLKGEGPLILLKVPES